MNWNETTNIIINKILRYVYWVLAVIFALPNQACVPQLNPNSEAIYSLPSDPNAYRGQTFHTFCRPPCCPSTIRCLQASIRWLMRIFFKIISLSSRGLCSEWIKASLGISLQQRLHWRGESGGPRGAWQSLLDRVGAPWWPLVLRDYTADSRQ